MLNRKVVGREFVIALGFVCVALAASLVGAVFYQNSNFRADLSYRDRQISSLQTQLDNYADIANLKKADYWLISRSANEPANAYMAWSFNANYAGYLWVNVESSTTNATYIGVHYESHGVWYDRTESVGSSGAVTFPILPGSIEIRVGNTDPSSGAIQVVTATYVY